MSIQNQAGPRAKKWDKTGMVVEVLPFDQYLVRVDGSGRVTRRNRQFLRIIGQGDSIADDTGRQDQSSSIADTTGRETENGKIAEGIKKPDTVTSAPTQPVDSTGNKEEPNPMEVRGHDDTAGDRAAPTQPLDTGNQDGGAWGGGVTGESSVSAASSQHTTRVSYSDVLKQGLGSLHFK